MCLLMEASSHQQYWAFRPITVHVHVDMHLHMRMHMHLHMHIHTNADAYAYAAYAYPTVIDRNWQYLTVIDRD